jgi:hypothetical protein
MKRPIPFGIFNRKHRYEADNRTLYLYNPSVLPLHNSVMIPSADVHRTSDPDMLSRADLDALTHGDASVRYVATYRAYLGSNCFGTDHRDLMTAGEQVNYLGIALLDAQLDIVNGTDVVIDINAGIGQPENYLRQVSEDCRIFLIRGVITLVCNELLYRIQLRRGMMRAPARRVEKEGVPYTYPNIYGKGLTVTLLDMPRRLAGGKNLNLFRAGLSSGHKKDSHGYYVQIFPLPHSYRRLQVPPRGIFETSLQRKFSRRLLNLFSSKEEKQQTSDAAIPAASFETPDSKHTILACPGTSRYLLTSNCSRGGRPSEMPFFGTRSDRGSACCLTLTWRGRAILVGITHAKTSWKTKFWLEDRRHRYGDRHHQYGVGRNQFVSRFVGYSPGSPFNVVALSGWFCLGFASEREGTRPGGNSLAGKNGQARLSLFNDSFDCPAIHFVSGMSEHVSDPSKAIIAYGVNDCYPRMIVIRKSAIARRLGLEGSFSG